MSTGLQEEQLTLFDLPNTPEEIGILLAPARLRRLDFSGLDFPTARRAIIEYIRTYFPDTFNDFVASNGIIMLSELVAAETNKLSLRSDILTQENFISTAQTEEAIVNLLALINQKIRRQTPAVVDIEISVGNPVATDIVIDPGLVFNPSSASDVFYEIYRAPGDFTSKIIIPASKRGIIAFGIEGQFASPIITTSPGGANQQFTIIDDNILESPIIVTVRTGDDEEQFEVTTTPIERFGPDDAVVETLFIGNEIRFKFGDNINGKAPLAGQEVEFRYRTGGGVRGRIGAGQIDEQRSITPLPPITAPVPVRFRNLTPSSGGTDKESLARAKRRAPRDFSLQGNIVTNEDYAQAAGSFSHPSFGSVSKALATIRTGLNANLVEVYVLAEGPNGQLAAPSVGLKRGLETFFSQLNVLTDTVRAMNGSIKPVDLDITVSINRNADATVVKDNVEQALTNFFSVENFEMGEGLFVSNLIEAIEAIDGVQYTDVFAPANNVLPTGALASPDDGPNDIGLNEVIVEGNRDIRYYYQNTRLL